MKNRNDSLSGLWAGTIGQTFRAESFEDLINLNVTETPESITKRILEQFKTIKSSNQRLTLERLIAKAISEDREHTLEKMKANNGGCNE